MSKLPKLTESVDIIQGLSDRPNALDGLDAAQLKAKFDEAANIIKYYLNNVLTPELEGGFVSVEDLEQKRKLSATGNFTGSWFGITEPTMADPGIANVVAQHTAQLDKITKGDLFINIKDYGAVGDGIKDDTAAIQAAINACPPLGIVWIPRGTFKVSQVNIVSKSTITIMGSGQLNGSADTVTGSIKAVFNIDKSANISIENINVTGTNSGVDDRGFWISDSKNVTIRQCRVTNFGQEAFYLWGANDSVESTNHIIDNYILGNNFGIKTAVNGEYWEIIGNKIIDNIWGVFGALGNCRVDNNKVIQNVYGVFLDGTLGTNPDHSSISNNQINHNKAVGLFLNNIVSGENVIGNEILSTVGPDVWPTTGKSHSLVMINVADIVFMGNRVDAAPGSTIYINRHSECRYIGNTFNGGEFKEEDVGGLNVYQGNRFSAPSKLVLHASTPKPIRVGDIEQGKFITDLSAGITKLAAILQNSWNTPAGYEALCYWKDSEGNIHLQGVIDSGTIGSIVSNLPEGYRPSTALDVAGSASNSGIHASFRIYTNGNVQHLSGGNTLVCVSAMFRP